MTETIATYCISSPASGYFYVGSTVDLHRRVRTHLSMLKRGAHYSGKLQQAWNKYQDVILTTHVDCSSIEEAEELELSVLRFYKGQELLCNASVEHLRGRAKGLLHTEESKALIAATIAARGAPMLGRKHSDETRSKMSASQRLRAESGIPVHSEEYLKRISKRVVIDGVEYSSVSGASRALGLATKTIRDRIASSETMYEGYRFVSETNQSEN